MAPIARSVIDLIGNTPLVRLKAASEATGCEILGKAEFLNPGQSVKDRAALGIIRDAESRGVLKPGGLIVEGTAGNTGIGLAMVANALGYRCIIVMPRTQSQEKKDAVRLFGAELVEVDAVAFAHPDHYTKVSRRLADEQGGVWANQFDNLANRRAHEETTGPEIWEQTGGKIDGFICSVGSGGTLGGISRALKACNPAIAIGIADPGGAALYHWYKHGELKATGTSITEGIGQGRVTANLEDVVVDNAYRVEDPEWLPVLFDLVRHEGLAIGGSAALNVVGAMRLAAELGPGKTIVTILCDYASRYQSKLFNRAFLTERGLPVADWL
ncbi:cysteine synthase [Candidatus Phycosocius bacilliformis]|uniref:cysteine synthase n=1 Tax=Candidatus Phycosocius bacilliformis TaxID=1445552 RepID=A0A2P2EE08_9PROT|nr:cysteine synthase A [Candidatus Phycosocius bacilliformis]GBF59286.1 cysteine synthase [Candidatus Phycosocius bacilliformis]